MSKDTGGPAFPSHGSMGEVTSEGLSLRDYFAAKAMHAIMSTPKPEPVGGADGLSMMAYQMADAMLKARKDTQ